MKKRRCSVKRESEVQSGAATVQDVSITSVESVRCVRDAEAGEVAMS
jgi:hypothetical protein